jgi:hypothetical protein
MEIVRKRRNGKEKVTTTELIPSPAPVENGNRHRDIKKIIYK